MAEELRKGRWKGARAFSRRLEDCSKDPRYRFSYEDGFYGFVRMIGNGYMVRITPREYCYPEGKISVSLWCDNHVIKQFSDVAVSRITDTADALEKMVCDPMTYIVRRRSNGWI